MSKSELFKVVHDLVIIAVVTKESHFERDTKTHKYTDIQMTLTFDFNVILIGQGRRFHPTWSTVSMTNSKEVILWKFKYF